MSVKKKSERFVFAKDVKGREASQGIIRKVLAFNGEVMCVVNEFEEGAVGAIHSHPHTQITYVAKGRFLFKIGVHEKEVSKGDSLLKQNEEKHGATCLEKGVLVDFFTPMREDFV